MKKSIFWLVVSVLAVLFLVQVVRVYIARQKKGETILENITPVVVQEVKLKNLKEILHFAGDIKAQDEIDVFPKVSGKLIMNKVKEGDLVGKGTVVALVDRDVTGLKFESFEVTSPIKGIVGKVYLDKGAGVNPPNPAPSMGTPIIRVINMDSVKVLLNIPERHLPKIKVGQLSQIKVDSYPGKIFEGKVSVVAPLVDLMTRTAAVELTIPNGNSLLKSGMFASVDLIVGEQKNAVSVPFDAVLGIGDERYVFLAQGDQALKRGVKLGISEGTDYEVISGVNAGEKLVVVGQEMLSDKSKIRIVEEGGTK